MRPNFHNRDRHILGYQRVRANKAMKLYHFSHTVLPSKQSDIVSDAQTFETICAGW